jgi:hypothetical protein
MDIEVCFQFHFFYGTAVPFSPSLIWTISHKALLVTVVGCQPGGPDELWQWYSCLGRIVCCTYIELGPVICFN